MIPYIFLIELCAGLFVFFYGMNKTTELLKGYMNAKGRVKISEIENQKSFHGLSAIVENSDKILDELHKLRAEQIKSGANEIALKPLDQRISNVELVKKNEYWLRYVSPYIDEIADAGLKALTRLAKSV